MKHPRWSRLVWVAPVLGLLWLAYAWRGAAREEPAWREVTRRDVRQTVTAVGSLEALTTVEVRSKANGLVLELTAEPGDAVRKGQVLARLDREHSRTFEREALAHAGVAQAQRDGVRAQIRQAVVEADARQVDLLAASCRRQAELFASGLIARQGLEDCERQLAAARTQLEAKRAEGDVLRQRLEQAEATVRAAAAVADRATEDLRNTVIVAPIDGVVLTRDVERGAVVSSILNQGVSATRLFTIGDTSSLFVNGQVDEVDVGKIRPGQPARVRVESLPGQTFDGVVTRIAPMAERLDNVTTFRVRVTIARPGPQLRPRMTASAELVVDEARDAVVVPEQCLLYAADGGVQVRLAARSPGGQPSLRALQVGLTDGTFRQVTAGLSPGERVLLR